MRTSHSKVLLFHHFIEEKREKKERKKEEMLVCMMNGFYSECYHEDSEESDSCRECKQRQRGGSCAVECKICHLGPEFIVPWLLGQRSTLRAHLKDLWKSINTVMQDERVNSQMRRVIHELLILLECCPLTCAYLDWDAGRKWSQDFIQILRKKRHAN